MLSILTDNFSQFYEQIGSVLVMQMQGCICNNIQINSF